MFQINGSDGDLLFKGPSKPQNAIMITQNVLVFIVLLLFTNWYSWY
jgi:hypothetical protein